MTFFANLHSLSDWALLVLRLGLGVTFLVHGRQKIPMWKMQPSAQLPAGMLSIMRTLSIAETAGGLGVTTGCLTQLAALGLAIVMLGAMRFKIMQWHRKFTGDGGWELDYALLAAAVTLFLTGGGRFALDRALWGL